MAHRADVIQVHQDSPMKDSSKAVVDPHCGKKMSQREARSVLFLDGDTIYFCSKECREKYRAPAKSAKAA